MATTQTTIRLDTEAKRQFETIVNELGMTASTAYNLFVHATIRHQGMPFDVTLDPLAHPALKDKVVVELERRTRIADAPDAKWLSSEDVRKELGL